MSLVTKSSSKERESRTPSRNTRGFLTTFYLDGRTHTNKIPCSNASRLNFSIIEVIIHSNFICFLLVDIHQLILNAWKPWDHFRQISWIGRRSCPKKIIARWWRNHFKVVKITTQQKMAYSSLESYSFRVFSLQIFLHLPLFWMYNKTIIGFRLSIISRIIQ